MYHLPAVLPAVKPLRLPLSRDQLMMLMMAINLIFLGVETYLSHVINGTIVPNEWIPIIFGPAAGGLLLVAGLLALKNRPAASLLATLTLLASVGVGFLGAYYHLVRGILPTGPAGERVSIDLLVWAPPILGPMIFAVVGLLGLSAAWLEDPPDSGRLLIFGQHHLQLPYSKTRAYFFIVAMASLATVVSSVLDHARLNFEDPWLWLPTIVGVFGAVVAASLGAIERPRRGDLLTYVAAMLLMIVIGPLGSWLHIQSNLTAGGAFVLERFIRGAPFLAPLLFSNVGVIGLLVLLDPREHQPATRSNRPTN